MTMPEPAQWDEDTLDETLQELQGLAGFLLHSGWTVQPGWDDLLGGDPEIDNQGS
jgi:hypothetical protein